MPNLLPQKITAAKTLQARAPSWASNSRDWTEHQYRSFHNSTRNTHCWHFDQDQRHVKNFSVVYACSRDDQRRFVLHNRLNEQGVGKVGPRKNQATPTTMELGEVNYKKLMCKDRTLWQKKNHLHQINESIFHMSSFILRGESWSLPDSRDVWMTQSLSLVKLLLGCFRSSEVRENPGQSRRLVTELKVMDLIIVSRFIGFTVAGSEIRRSPPGYKNLVNNRINQPRTNWWTPNFFHHQYVSLKAVSFSALSS